MKHNYWINKVRHRVGMAFVTLMARIRTFFDSPGRPKPPVGARFCSRHRSVPGILLNWSRGPAGGAGADHSWCSLLPSAAHTYTHTHTHAHTVLIIKAEASHAWDSIRTDL